MRILIVGAGAVGQVFGYFLRSAGVEIAYYARSATAAKLNESLEEEGLPLFRISRKRGRSAETQHLTGCRVFTDTSESRDFAPDQIWFTTPSTVFYTEWFGEFLKEVPAGRVVCFAPEGAHPDILSIVGDSSRFVFGGITFMAWQGDLNGGGGRSGCVNYWLPPGAALPLMGTTEACRDVKNLLVSAGLSATVQSPGYRRMQASVTSFLSTFVAGFELSGWTFGAFRRGPWLAVSARACREAIRGQFGWAGPWSRILLAMTLSTAGYYLATFFLPVLLPFDAEKYLGFHYRKTGTQSRHLLDLFLRDTVDKGLPADNIKRLIEGLREAAGADRS